MNDRVLALDLQLDLQIASDANSLPTQTQFAQWISHTLQHLVKLSFVEMTLGFVDVYEMTHLNETYRKKSGPTNVLSFPFTNPPGMTLPLLGDIIICADIIRDEAKAQGKSLEAHWAHMVIHGCLHLLGYDHLNDEQAQEMEPLEIYLLEGLGYKNPY